MTINTNNDLYDERPWYKQGWPWFLISFPAMSVVLGLNMLYLASQTNNSLVVDDYYKQGKLISQLSVRDQLAAQLQLSAEVRAAHEGIVVQLSRLSSSVQAFNYPAELSLRWVHVTQSQKDGSAALHHMGGGRYFEPKSELPREGKWRLHLQPVADTGNPSVESTWRLVSHRVTLSGDATVSLDYR